MAVERYDDATLLAMVESIDKLTNESLIDCRQLLDESGRLHVNASTLASFNSKYHDFFMTDRARSTDQLDRATAEQAALKKKVRRLESEVDGISPAAEEGAEREGSAGDESLGFLLQRTKEELSELMRSLQLVEEGLCDSKEATERKSEELTESEAPHAEASAIAAELRLQHLKVQRLEKFVKTTLYREKKQSEKAARKKAFVS